MESKTLNVGTIGEKSLLGEERYCTRRRDCLIFSRPNMVQLAEWAAMDALLPFLREGDVSVGTRVEVLHQAPTLEGMNVRAVTTLIEIDGARLVFDIEVVDELGKVGQVSHERYLLEYERYIRRLEKKKAGFTALQSQ